MTETDRLISAPDAYARTCTDYHLYVNDVNVPRWNYFNQSAYDNTKLRNERFFRVFAGWKPRLVALCFPFSVSDWVVNCQKNVYIEVCFSIFIILFLACCGNWCYRTVGWWFFSENFRTWNSPCHVLCSVVSFHMQFEVSVHVHAVIKTLHLL